MKPRIDQTQFGSDEAAAYFKRNNCQVELPTPAAVQAWNAAAGAVIGLLHVTC
jgi:hypothetical protein